MKAAGAGVKPGAAKMSLARKALFRGRPAIRFRA